MNDIRPPKRPLQSSVAPQPESLSSPIPSEPLLIPPEISPAPLKKPRSKKKAILIIVGCLLGLIVVGVIAAFIWYQSALKPVNSGNTDRTRIEVVQGSSPSQIGQLLEERQLIRSSLAFDIYTRLSKTRAILQAGAYNLSPSESLGEIVGHMTAGRTDEFSLTFFPGGTLTDATDTPESKKTDAQTVLLRAGYSKEAITAAFAKTYDHPLFATKPQDTSLEGYIYGETYNFSSDATVEQILTRTFDEYYAKIKENNLVAAYKKQGLTLYEGITLASIIQREEPNPSNQKQIAQVFYLRQDKGMPLGSDVTAYYGADLIGAPRAVSVDTPYNTRMHEGLPPGPIASPGITALRAVASPAKGSYVYFLSGDDDITYFAHTIEEHEANIRDHCAVKCSID